ncbi:hypothetical protein [Gemmobacter sp. 24YEA27]|uniref:hypothetical protein n=1 Tax=Gemmobacter sp. 24YEA27 TaxID=3040672 RepID=UPI0024B36D92|nr:hypothetical protein [Gemmobacter sp. 24YEA27]
MTKNRPGLTVRAVSSATIAGHSGLRHIARHHAAVRVDAIAHSGEAIVADLIHHRARLSPEGRPPREADGDGLFPDRIDALDPAGQAALLQLIGAWRSCPAVSETEVTACVQLVATIRACRDCASLSAAGRRRFAASRQDKASQNDADGLRKYLARFGLDRAEICA